jgi:hypothetical protein
MNLVFPEKPGSVPPPPPMTPEQEEAFLAHSSPQAIAPVPVNPYDLAPVKKALEPYLAKIDAMAVQAQAVTVKDDATQAQAVEMAGQVKRLGKAIETARKEFVAAPNDYVGQVNGLAKSITAKTDAIERGLKAKLREYDDVVEAARIKAEAEARKAAIEAQRLIDEEARLAREKADAEAAEAKRIADEAAKAGSAHAAHLAEVAAAEQAKAEVVSNMEIVKVEVPFIPKSTGVVHTASGTSSPKKHWTFKVQDAKAVPREYLMVNEKAIRQAVAQGVRNIAGVCIFEDKQIAIRA